MGRVTFETDLGRAPDSGFGYVFARLAE